MNAINKNPHIKKLINKLTFKLICKIEWGKQVRDRQLSNSKKDGRPFLLGYSCF